jgi:hypothetical protein
MAETQQLLKKAQAAAKPRLACLGKITTIADVKEPQNGGLYHHIPIEITPVQAGQKATLRLLFWPEAFVTDPDSLSYDGTKKKGVDKANDENRSRSFVYRRNLSSESDDAFLQVLIAGKEKEFFEALGKVLVKGRVEPAEFRKVLVSFIANKDIAYVLRQEAQKKDGSDKRVLGDRY